MKNVYLLSEYKDKNIRELFGKKCTYISEIAELGLPVMNGIVLTANVCNKFYIENQKINDEILSQINNQFNKLEQLTGKKLGNIDEPLLVSIKCSPKSDMPNIMENILNVGLTYEIVENLSENTDEYVWIWECYFNLIKNYSKIVEGINLDYYEKVKEILNNSNSQLSIEQLRNLCKKLKEEYKLNTQTEFPDNAAQQIYSIINAAFKSWNNKKASIYRKDLDIPFEEGMAICIQPMVFGNMNKNCATGTIFTRDPITGYLIDNFTNEKYFIGKFSKQSIENSVNINQDFINKETMFANEFPDIYKQLETISRILEKNYQDMLKIDFVVENNKLFITEVSKGKRTAQAGLRIQCDIFEEYVLNRKNENSEDREKKVCFDFVFGGFKQKEIEPLDNVVKKRKTLKIK